MNTSLLTKIAALLGAMAVGLGAFGAHGLKTLLENNGTAQIWEKAVFYHFIHTVMLFVLAENKLRRPVAWWSFLAGIILFSGSLYTLAISNVRWWGAVTPVGGVALVVGWISLLFPPKDSTR
jgi:uncharacterized membrane protein YgdD (TMEM256/DUF423 family)